MDATLTCRFEVNAGIEPAWELILLKQNQFLESKFIEETKNP
ncbi:hypothetical protein [Bacillus sp. SRB1LM]|nr:hypothetical protein [Bacillus sp. SRB1LM]